MNATRTRPIDRILRICLSMMLAGLAAAAPPAMGQSSLSPPPGASVWSSSMHASMRLIDGGPDATNQALWRAGVEIRMDPHFKTYWRTPGDSGLPPVFDWAASQNVANVEVLWPAPYRFEDTAGSSIGYVGSVVFPVRVTLADPRKPGQLVLKLDYAVCEKVCIPARGEARLPISRQGLSTPNSLVVLDWETRVPREARLGAADAPALRSVAAAPSGEALTITAVVPDKASIVDVFVEGPDPWVFGAPLAVATLPQGPGTRLVTYLVKVDNRPKDGKLPGMALRLTLTAGDDAVETAAQLDAAGSAP
ncbi:protein-disulfide reductase DsbD domain-containing protein [uncultured Alsobacter sp.]|uniref:protein-disulfide reductase DsbD domain-containing protein n=1 Tax=uncultured Alsobacter sp. TaxID=1748258 RepID=UPI0025FEAFDA|nr:protein-disulfide reductase DsbD domain-containing protein [uncultured Alsobacter sp.]